MSLCLRGNLEATSAEVCKVRNCEGSDTQILLPQLPYDDGQYICFVRRVVTSTVSICM